MNLRTTFRPFYMSRHGQSEYNECGRIGGDSGLSQHGTNYAHKLAEFVHEKIIKDSEGNIWTIDMNEKEYTLDEYGDRAFMWDYR